MEHETIVRDHTPERYFLGELPAAERDDFEEHLADCPVCRQELAAADIFAANAVAVFEDAATQNVESKSRGWLAFLRPRAFPVLAFSGVLNIALLIFAGYGVTRMSQISRPVVSEVFTVRPAARGANDQVFTVGKSKPVVILQFDLPRQYRKYSYSLEGAGQKVDLDVPGKAETLNLAVPVARLQPGEHKLRVVGWDGQQDVEIGHCVLRVEPAK